jgi:drug/metabolite transporter (DMT)-like permease
MSAESGVGAAGVVQSTRWLDLTAIVFCTLAWGTTWFAITLQLGVVDPVISVTYRFTLAAALLFAWCMLRGESLMLTRAQHVAALGVGISTFAINYTLVYWAEERVTSAVVAVVFAAMAFINLIGFRIAFGQRASILAWGAASLGIAGVALLSWEEIAGANFGMRAVIGLGLTFLGVIGAVVGNIYARQGEIAGATVAASTGWAMAYGAAILAIFATFTGRAWVYEFGDRVHFVLRPCAPTRLRHSVIHLRARAAGRDAGVDFV